MRFSVRIAGSRPGSDSAAVAGGTPISVNVPPTPSMANAISWVGCRPMASKAWSTPPSVSARTALAAPASLSMPWVAPKRRASSSFAGTRSTAITVWAPLRRAPWITLSPTPPQPITTTVSPGRTLAVLMAAPTPVTTAQPSTAARSSGISRGITATEFSCTSTCSAKPPRLAICRTGRPFSVRRGFSSAARAGLATQRYEYPPLHCRQ